MSERLIGRKCSKCGEDYIEVYHYPTSFALRLCPDCGRWLSAILERATAPLRVGTPTPGQRDERYCGHGRQKGNCYFCEYGPTNR